MRQNKTGLSYPYASDAIRAIYGIDAEIEMIAIRFLLIHPEDVEAVIEKLKSQKI
jgi:hypothetical protein